MRRLPPVLALLVVLAVVIAALRSWPLMHEAPASAAREPGVVDIRFAQFMAQHHDQAILMAQGLLDGPADGAGQLARAVFAQQLLELGEMRGWLRLWGQSSVPESRSMDWMLLSDAPPDASLRQYLLDCQRSAAGMPGMASAAELAQLRQAEGIERERLFLTLMRRHHEGGLPMARFAARYARLPVVRELASRIVGEQVEEIAAIQVMQARLESAASVTP